ncbi:MaoC/PaaZ C-terminal domain-containing protein, partial [Parapedomonas caeni]
ANSTITMNPVATSDAAFRGGACPTPEYTIAYTGNYTTSADANRDPDPMHIDPDYAREHSPFGQTILFGFQTLSMLSNLCSPVRYRHGGGVIGYDLNYGLNRVRFISPVPVNARFRNRMSLKSVERREDGSYLITSENVIEIEGQERPALIAEWIGLVSREDAQ